MATIPNPASLTRTIGSGQRRVSGIDTRNVAPIELANSLRKISDKKARFELSKAETNFLSNKHKEDNAYDQDTD